MLPRQCEDLASYQRAARDDPVQEACMAMGNVLESVAACVLFQRFYLH